MIEGETMTKKVDVQNSAKLLQQELSELEDQIDTLKAKLDYHPNFARSVSDPRITSWALDQVSLRKLKSRRKSLKRALKSVDDGTYGICKQCKKPINPDRLAVLHDASLCIDCAKKKKT
jgi:RNA polymerase-binding transcription factor DksA